MAPRLTQVAGPLIFIDRTDGSDAQEIIMAKEQKRGNREVRKPKAAKPPVVAATSSLLTKGMLTPVGLPKKKR